MHPFTSICIHLHPPLTAVHLDEEYAAEGAECEEDDADHDGEGGSLLQDEVLLVAHFYLIRQILHIYIFKMRSL